MLLNRVFKDLWSKGNRNLNDQIESESPKQASADRSAIQASNVVSLSLTPGLEGPVIGETGEAVRDSGASRRGLMNAAEIEQFFADNYFWLGRHNGAHYRNAEALALGKQGLIARFQNVLADLIGRRKAKVHRVQLELLAVGGISEIMTAQLGAASEHLRREIDELGVQADLALRGQGWVMEALNRYHLGFNKGLKEAMEFDLLGG